MNLRNIFRRTRPTPAPPRMDPLEAAIACAWGFNTEEEWLALEDWERATFRTNYLKAPRRT